MSDKTLQHQADQRRILGHKNPNKLELSSSSDNIKHIIDAMELIASETEITKAGVLDSARIARADKLNVPESSISDQSALQGIIFLNKECTIERVN